MEQTESKTLDYTGNFSGSHDGVNYDVSYKCSHDIDSSYEADIRDYVEEQISNGYDSGYESFEMSTGFYEGEIEIEGTVTWESSESFDAEYGADIYVSKKMREKHFGIPNRKKMQELKTAFDNPNDYFSPEMWDAYYEYVEPSYGLGGMHDLPWDDFEKFVEMFSQAPYFESLREKKTIPLPKSAESFDSTKASSYVLQFNRIFDDIKDRHSDLMELNGGWGRENDRKAISDSQLTTLLILQLNDIFPEMQQKVIETFKEEIESAELDEQIAEEIPYSTSTMPKFDDISTLKGALACINIFGLNYTAVAWATNPSDVRLSDDMKDADDVRHHFLDRLLEAQMNVIDNLNVFSYNQVFYAQQILNKIFETTGSIKQIYSSLETFDKDLSRDIYSYDDMPHLDYNPEDKTLSFKAPKGYTEKGPRPFYGNPRKMALDRWGNRRFIRRRKDGTYMKNVDVGRSLAMDRRRQSQTWAPAGFRDQGDGSPSLLVRLLDMFKGVDEEVLMAESYLMCADCDNYSSECGCHNSESDAYIYAYNDGHSDGRANTVNYRPSTTDRELTAFKKIFKQAEDENLTVNQQKLSDAFEEYGYYDVLDSDPTIITGMEIADQKTFQKLLKVCQENDGIIDSSHPAEAYIIAIKCWQSIFQ